MKNILLIMTGGTIGSTLKKNTVDTSDAATYSLLQRFNADYPSADQIHFKTRQLTSILSENIQPEFWQILIQAIESETIENYDGIIITHGTDTLAFTAAALGLYFNAINIPLLLVSSHLPLQHPDANGFHNFMCAVDYIVQNQPAGVFVPYQNPGHDMTVHRGIHLLSSLPLSSDFISARFSSDMRYEAGQFIHVNTIPYEQQPVRLKPIFSARILLIRPYPGLDYRNLKLTGIDCVLHDLYHSGTACALDENNPQSALYVLNQCQKQGLTVYFAPIEKRAAVYSTTRQLLENGAEFIWDMTLEAAYAKLLLAFGNFDSDPTRRQFLDTNIAGEKIIS